MTINDVFFAAWERGGQLAAHYPVLRYTLAVFSRAPPLAAGLPPFLSSSSIKRALTLSHPLFPFYPLYFSLFLPLILAQSIIVVYLTRASMSFPSSSSSYSVSSVTVVVKGRAYTHVAPLCCQGDCATLEVRPRSTLSPVISAWQSVISRFRIDYSGE